MEQDAHMTRECIIRNCPGIKKDNPICILPFLYFYSSCNRFIIPCYFQPIVLSNSICITFLSFPVCRNVFKYVIKLKFLIISVSFSCTSRRTCSTLGIGLLICTHANGQRKKGLSRNKRHTVNLKIQFKFIHREMF
jgi:hypothetical protein